MVLHVADASHEGASRFPRFEVVSPHRLTNAAADKESAELHAAPPLARISSPCS